ncbi:GNAT family N-acetyltransferase [Thermodesulfobacteriota bacterium]
MSIKVEKQRVKINTETFERFESFFKDEEIGLRWNCLFVLPAWLKTWWDTFGGNQKPEILTGYLDGKLIGIAPLRIEGKTARFIGEENVCDYQDTIMSSNHHLAFLKAILSHLQKKGIRRLQLGDLRPESPLINGLPKLTEQMGYTVICDQVGSAYELALPKTWESYLQMLNGKQRHEIRRKMRRLNEAGHIRFRIIHRFDEISESMDQFFSMFRASRPDKSEFLTDRMVSFFLLLAERTAHQGLLRISFLDIDRVPAAAVICFDFNDTIFLYNNGYDPRFRHLSAGLLSKVYSIRNSIERGKLRYDLLKGDEVYKKRLGSKPIPLYRLKIDLER